MNLEKNIINIIVYSLSISFFVTQVLVDWTKDLIVRVVYKYNRYLYKRGKVDGYDLSNKTRTRLRYMKVKPFDCMGCMGFWVSLIIAFNNGFASASIAVGIVGYFFGAITEALIKRYL